MASIGPDNITVRPEVLIAKAQEVSKDIELMNEYITELGNLISRTDHFWIGEAGDLHRNLYQKQKSEIDIIFRRLREHPRDMTEIANNYLGIELNVTESAQELAGNVIS